MSQNPSRKRQRARSRATGSRRRAASRDAARALTAQTAQAVHLAWIQTLRRLGYADAAVAAAHAQVQAHLRGEPADETRIVVPPAPRIVVPGS